MQKGFCTCQESKVLQQVVRNQGASTVEAKVHERIYEGEEKIRQSLKLKSGNFRVDFRNSTGPAFLGTRKRDSGLRIFLRFFQECVQSVHDVSIAEVIWTV